MKNNQLFLSMEYLLRDDISARFAVVFHYYVLQTFFFIESENLNFKSYNFHVCFIHPNFHQYLRFFTIFIHSFNCLYNLCNINLRDNNKIKI